MTSRLLSEHIKPSAPSPGTIRRSPTGKFQSETSRTRRHGIRELTLRKSEPGRKHVMTWLQRVSSHLISFTVIRSALRLSCIPPLGWSCQATVTQPTCTKIPDRAGPRNDGETPHRITPFHTSTRLTGRTPEEEPPRQGPAQNHNKRKRKGVFIRPRVEVNHVPAEQALIAKNMYLTEQCYQCRRVSLLLANGPKAAKTDDGGCNLVRSG